MISRLFISQVWRRGFLCYATRVSFNSTVASFPEQHGYEASSTQGMSGKGSPPPAGEAYTPRTINPVSAIMSLKLFKLL